MEQRMLPGNYGALTSWRDVDEIDAHVEPGDKVEFDRGVYSHVGIADGRGNVIHYSGEPKLKSGAHIRRDRLTEVAGGDKVRINNSEDKKMKPLPKREILRRAEKALGTGHGAYNLTTNNCEHKATDMRYGEPVSEQVSTGEKFLLGAAIGAFAIGTAWMLFGKSEEEEEEDQYKKKAKKQKRSGLGTSEYSFY